ncbi:fimbrial biogenesis chaperone [Aeromonas salmonicida]|uniref:fimbrial biogenesis chaperone n=1 Tax=Aeromonas salmonicida TaxID=645 RepID=UPI003CFC9968
MALVITTRHWVLAAGWFTALLSMLMVSTAHAGVVLGATRVIYPAELKEVTLPLKNTETSQTFLVQSVIESATGDKQPNFVVTPPLFVLKAGGENKLRVFLKTVVPMPLDRETLFWMSIKAVPSALKQEGNFVQFAITNRIKLLYRPKGLVMPDNDIWKKVEVSVREKEVVMANPTPYYMNIASVTLGPLVLENLTLAPFATQVVGKTTTAVKQADVVFINDFGGDSDKITVPVT